PRERAQAAREGGGADARGAEVPGEAAAPAAERSGPPEPVVRAHRGDEEGRRAPGSRGEAGERRRERDAREPGAGGRAAGVPGAAAAEAQGDERDPQGHPEPG